MNLLLDECVDRRLGRELQGHFVSTVPKMGWAAKKNGELLALAERQFEVFITTDQNLSFQQNLMKFQNAVLILCAPTNRLADLKPLVPEVLSVLPNVKVGEILKIGAE